MVIQVKSFANLKTYTAHLPSGGELEINDGSTVAALLKELRLPAESKCIVLVNGRFQDRSYVLQSGDVLVFFPPVEGG